MASTESFIGSVELWPLTWAPRNWAFCQGQLLAISQYQALFSLIGTMYGGDGRTTFALPDFRGRVPAGAGQGPGLQNLPLAQKAGQPATTLTIDNLPAHDHSVDATVKPLANNGRPTDISPENNYNAPVQNTNAYSNSQNCAMGACDVDITIGATGGSMPFDNHQPYLVLNYIICLDGIYPPRP